jgi:branched-chain amino acid aminotransferase
MTLEETTHQQQLTSTRKFGSTVSPHMLLSSYQNGSWDPFQITAFQKLSLAPTAMVFHYGQTIFEGMKAFKRVDGKVSVFRMQKHYERFQHSSLRMCMPEVPYELFYEGIRHLLLKDISHVPEGENSALYIRPFLFASEEHFGARAAEEYQFIIFTGAVDDYYDQPLRVKVEDLYVRAAKGGIGYAKCGGNYGGSFYPTVLARKQGFDQVIWTDGSPELNMEESGTMNLFFLIGDVLITPPLSDTILDGITRDSVITIAKEWGIKVEERKISAFELIEASRKGLLQEAFGCGTAAVTIPMASIMVKDEQIELPHSNKLSLSSKLRQYLNDLRRGLTPDKYSWITIIGE